MMIKKYAKIIKYNFSKETYPKTQPIEISDETNTSDNVTVYFDAALSRDIVKNKAVYAKYVSITENKETVYFVYDKNNFINETKFEEFRDLINTAKGSSPISLEIYTGGCVCTYIPGLQAIRVYPEDEVSINEKEFKLI